MSFPRFVLLCLLVSLELAAVSANIEADTTLDTACSITDSETQCAASENNCAWKVISEGFGICLTAESAAAFETPEAQNSVKCSALTTKHLCCVSDDDCGWGTTNGLSFCTGTPGLQWVPRGNRCKLVVPDTSSAALAPAAAVGAAVAVLAAVAVAL